MSKKSSIALIVPCYNESMSIPHFGIELIAFTEKFKVIRPELDLSIIIVDNNSTDDSVALLKDLQLKLDCLTLETCSLRGYGAALKHGFKSANAEYLSFLDLDNTYPLNSIFDLLNELQKKELDIVYGARIHKASGISLIRSVGNRFYVLLLKWFFNSKLSDVCSGMRVFKASLKTDVMGLASNDLSFSIDFTSFALANGWKISELPILYRTRTGHSKLSVVSDGLRFLRIVLINFLRKLKNV